jgi:SAM-dependent methyltransferase
MKSEAVEQHNRTQLSYFGSAIKPTMVPVDTPYIRRHVQEMIRFADLKPSDRVLEIGCGMGRYTIPLFDAGIRIEGLDLSPFLLARLDEYSGQRSIPLHNADVWHPPVELEGKFDKVIGFFTLHHLHELERCFTSMAKLVKPGGRVVFLEPNAYNVLYYLQVLLSPGMTWEGDRGIVQMRGGRVFPAMSAAGLHKLSIRRFGFFPPFIANRGWGQRLERIVERVTWNKVLPFQLFAGDRPSR